MSEHPNLPAAAVAAAMRIAASHTVRPEQTPVYGEMNLPHEANSEVMDYFRWMADRLNKTTVIPKPYAIYNYVVATTSFSSATTSTSA